MIRISKEQIEVLDELCNEGEVLEIDNLEETIVEVYDESGAYFKVYWDGSVV